MDESGTGAGMSLLDFPPGCLDTIGSMLSSPIGKNYKDLAAKLGYTQQEVQDMEVRSPCNPGQILLEKFSKRPLATVAVLKTYLERLDRWDVIKEMESRMGDDIDLVVVLKDESGQSIRMCLPTEGSKTIREALEAEPRMADLLPKIKCQISILDKKASCFKGMEVNFEKYQNPCIISNSDCDVLPSAGTDQDNNGNGYQMSASRILLSHSDPFSIYLSLPKTGQDGDEEISGFHPQAVNNKVIVNILSPYLEKDNHFIVRPSRSDPADRCISVTTKGGVMNYKIHRRTDGKYYVFEAGPHFQSISVLLLHYRQHPLSEDNSELSPKLMYPIE